MVEKLWQLNQLIGSLISDFSKMMTKPISSNSKNKTTYSIDRLDRRGIYLSQGHNVK